MITVVCSLENCVSLLCGTRYNTVNISPYQQPEFLTRSSAILQKSHTTRYPSPLKIAKTTLTVYINSSIITYQQKCNKYAKYNNMLATFALLFNTTTPKYISIPHATDAERRSRTQQIPDHIRTTRLLPMLITPRADWAA